MEKQVLLGKYLEENPLVLAPMAGITDRTFREIAREHGASLCYTEMISAKALSYKNIKTRDLMDIEKEKGPVAVQLFGNEPELMAQAAQLAESLGADMVDVNMGCPVPKVYKNGEGSALLNQPKLAGEIVKAMVKAVKIPVSVKMRIGVSQEKIVAVDFAKTIADAGASLIAVHGRTREQYYSGEADWNTIQKVKEALESYPVWIIGNGDIFSLKDHEKHYGTSGVDGTMAGRGTLGNPWLFEGVEATAKMKVDMALEHVKRLMNIKEEDRAIPEMRKHIAWYLKGLRNTARLKDQIFHTVKYEECKDLLEDYLSDLLNTEV